ncbi:MAG: hypothetical protein WDO24_29385 [Pseudomonadota bacterium]
MNVHSLNPPLLNPFGLNPVSGLGYSPYGGPVPLGGFGAPYTIGIKQPASLFNYSSTGASQLSYSLKDQAGGLVSVGTATDAKGATVLTATLNTSKGSIIAFQSASPSGLTSTGTRPANLPSVTDSTRKAVPYSVAYDQYGGAVLQIQLTDVNGKSTKLYSQVDSLGFPISGGPAATRTSTFTDLQGVQISASQQTDQNGNSVSVATLTDAAGHSVQYATQSASVPSLSTILSTTNPVGAQAAQAGPQDSKGNTINNLTLYTAAGNSVDQITLYSSTGSATTFYSLKDSAGNATQALQLTPTPAKATLAAFSSSPTLTPTATPQLPKSIQPYATPSLGTGGFFI